MTCVLFVLGLNDGLCLEGHTRILILSCTVNTCGLSINPTRVCESYQ